MSWGKILNNIEKVEFFITLTEENMDKFSANDKEYVRLILKMLRENYSENVFQGLKIFIIALISFYSYRSSILRPRKWIRT